MRRKATREHQPSLLQTASQIIVTMVVAADHPLLLLKRALDWPAIREVIIRYLRVAGRNVDHRPGRPLDVDLYVPVIVLQLVKNLNPRALEELLAESAAARVFIDWENDTRMQVRDHSNIARITEVLGEEGRKELNALIVNHAIALGFADPSVLSGDTTAQELPIGFPHEAGLLQGFAQRCQRALRKLLGKGKRGIKKVEEKIQEILLKAKEYHLFAKTEEEKQKVLRNMLRKMPAILRELKSLTGRMAKESDRVIASATARLQEMLGIGLRLVPQIKTWLKTGKAVKGRLLHTVLTEARAIARNKAGKKWEYGLQYLIGALGGGYVFGVLITKPTGEPKMPMILLEAYRRIVGAGKLPNLFIYDRGGWSEENAQVLLEKGVKKVGIQPKGQAQWRVHGTDRMRVQSERAQMEGKIGTLKTEKYGFNKPRQRKPERVRAAGQRSILSFNLNKMMRDLAKKVAKQPAAA